MNEADIHMWPIDEICRYFGTNRETGLTVEEAERRLEINGPNNLTQLKTDSRWKVLLIGAFRGIGLLMSIGWLFSVICILQGYFKEHHIDNEYLGSAALCGTIFVLWGLVRFGYSYDDFRPVLSFRTLQPKYCTVLRNGQKWIVLSVNVVVGDVLIIAAGERIAADVCFFEVNDLWVNNVALVGFTTPVNVDPKVVHKEKWITCNLGFACSHAIRGNGRGIVIACGDNTEMGVMVCLSMEPRPNSRVKNHIRQVNKIVMCLIALIWFGLAVSVWFVRLEWQDCIEYSTRMIIYLTPFPATLMMLLTLINGRNRFLAKKCYVRNMEAALTVGLTSVICSTIVGSLTTRQTDVTEVFVDMTTQVFSSKSLVPVDASYRFMELIRVAVLCNDAEYYPAPLKLPVGKKSATGTDFDIAVLEFAQKYINDVDLLRQKLPRVAYKPHNSIDHLNITINEIELPNGEFSYLLLLKGNYEAILGFCRSFAINDEEVALDDDLRDFINDEASQLTQQGRYVIGFAYKELTEAEEHLLMQHNEYDIRDFLGAEESPLRFLGFIATNDPLRPDTVNAVQKCQLAGIKLVLLTRGPLYYASAIAKQLGIAEVTPDGNTTSCVIDMKKVYLNNYGLRRFIENALLSQPNLLFASIKPSHYHMIVDVCRSLGAVVTSLGSNLYDIPAFRHSNVGVARGITSSLTTKLCADMLLLDDSFATLVKVIEESRLLFENSRKMLAYIMSPNMALIISTFCYIFLEAPPRVSINASFIISMAISLAGISILYEGPEENLMKQKPKVYDDFPMNRRFVFVIYLQVGIIQACAAQCSSYIVMAQNGFMLESFVGKRTMWYDPSVNDLTDSYGQEWTHAARVDLEYQVSLAFVMTILIMQAANLVIKRTGRASLLKQGFGNTYMKLGLLYLTVLGVFLCVVNKSQYLLVKPLEKYNWMIYVLPFVVFFIFMGSLRRYLLRSFPGSWFEETTFY